MYFNYHILHQIEVILTHSLMAIVDSKRWEPALTSCLVIQGCGYPILIRQSYKLTWCITQKLRFFISLCHWQDEDLPTAGNEILRNRRHDLLSAEALTNYNCYANTTTMRSYEAVKCGVWNWGGVKDGELEMSGHKNTRPQNIQQTSSCLYRNSFPYIYYTVPYRTSFLDLRFLF